MKSAIKVILLFLFIVSVSHAADMGGIACDVTNSGSITSPEQEDTWTFSGQEGERILICVKRTSGSLYPRIILFPPDGGNYEGWNDGFLDHQLRQSGTYRIVIYDGDSGAGDSILEDTGDYDITFVNLQACTLDAIPCDVTLSADIDGYSDMDMYQFEGQAGDRVLVSAEKTLGSLYPCIVLYPPDGGSYEGWGYEFLSHQLRQSGTYTIVVYDGDSGAGDSLFDDTGDYNITFVNLQACTFDTIPCDETLTSKIDVYSDIDIFQFEGQAGNRVLISAEKTLGSLYPCIVLYPPDGGSYEGWGYEFLSHQLRQSGTYRIVIYDGDSGAGDGALDDTGDYNITFVNLQACIYETFPCNFALPRVIDAYSDIDVFQFKGQTGDRVQISAEKTLGSLYPCIVLYPPDGGNYEGWNYEFLDHQLQQSGAYTVVVYDGDSGAGDGALDDTGDYNIRYVNMDGGAEMSLDVSSTDGGSIIIPGEGRFPYYENEEVLIYSEPDDPNYFIFDHWTGSAVDANKVVDPCSACTTVMMEDDYTVHANFIIIPDVHVDDNALNDPGPNDPDVSDPDEDGSQEHPFDSIQEAIGMSRPGGTVIVHEGRYLENIIIDNKPVSLIANWLIDPDETDTSIIEAAVPGPVVTFADCEDPNCQLKGFVIQGGVSQAGAAVDCLRSSPVISNCLICGNIATDNSGAVILCSESNADFVNCTISGNIAGNNGSIFSFIDCNAGVLNSIIWDNDGESVRVVSGNAPDLNYCDVEDGYPGSDNMNANPSFVSSGSWNGDMWIEGDYHLISRRGYFDSTTGQWYTDDSHSRCIDAGDPASPYDAEPEPNGDCINMGFYGGTNQASKSIK